MQAKIDGIEACVFDAYGTLFDVASVTHVAADALGARAPALADLWRGKQLQYTWLRGLGGRHADFRQVTGEALDFALQSLAIDVPGLRERLMQAYLSVAAYPEVAATLRTLKARGLRLAILSNGTPAMLQAAAEHAGIADAFDAILSVEQVGVFKPHPAVYALAASHFALPAEKICFLSSNGWDAYSAKAFGFRVLWCNRFAQAAERIPETPDGEIATLAELPAWLGRD